jgi:hypothetical protein
MTSKQNADRWDKLGGHMHVTHIMPKHGSGYQDWTGKGPAFLPQETWMMWYRKDLDEFREFFLLCVCVCVWQWDLNSGPHTCWARYSYCWSHSNSPFCDGFFWDRVSKTICPGWLWTEILLISVSWIARITSISYLHPTTSRNQISK